VDVEPPPPLGLGCYTGTSAYGFSKRNQRESKSRLNFLLFKKKLDGEFNQRDDEKGPNFDDDYNLITVLSLGPLVFSTLSLTIEQGDFTSNGQHRSISA
jgi:hypothetical protein